MTNIEVYVNEGNLCASLPEVRGCKRKIVLNLEEYPFRPQLQFSDENSIIRVINYSRDDKGWVPNHEAYAFGSESLEYKTLDKLKKEADKIYSKVLSGIVPEMRIKIL